MRPGEQLRWGSFGMMMPLCHHHAGGAYNSAPKIYQLNLPSLTERTDMKPDVRSLKVGVTRPPPTRHNILRKPCRPFRCARYMPRSKRPWQGALAEQPEKQLHLELAGSIACMGWILLLAASEKPTTHREVHEILKNGGLLSPANEVEFTHVGKYGQGF